MRKVAALFVGLALAGVVVGAIVEVAPTLAPPPVVKKYGFPSQWGGGTSGGGGAVSSVSGTNNLTCSPTTGAVSCSGSALLAKASNLSDLASASTARTNLGLATIASSGSGADLTANSVTTAKLATTAVTAGSYTSTNLTVGADGRITAASNGTGGGAVTTFQTQTVAGSDTNTMTFSGLNGDSDNAIYEGDITGVMGVGCTAVGGAVAINFNAITTNQRSISSHMTPTTSIAGLTNDTIANIGFESPAGKVSVIHFRVNPKSGNYRVVEWFNATSDSATSANNQIFSGFSFWYDTSTNVTSIQLKDPTHNFFGIATVATLRKVSL